MNKTAQIKQKTEKGEIYLYDKTRFVLNVRKKLIFVKSWLKLSGAQLLAISLKYYFHA